ncbi:MAG: hybrid sensor histidine kinase/response regulator [Anaerolineae bacterium]|nr:hybrid sensor histidine kinase/response regulator [Anaerolineae bacterium]
MAVHRHHVLLVDDDPEQQTRLVNLLLARDLAVSTAPDAARAFRLLENGLRPDLILCALDVPRLTALRFVQTVRATQAWTAIPIVLTSPQDDPALLMRALKLGADDFLVKPMEDERLLLTIYNRVRRTQELTRYAQTAYDMLSHMQQDMAHLFTQDLREPLISLNMAMELLTGYTDSLSEDDRREVMDALQGGVLRLNRLVEQMVLLVQLDAGELQPFIREAGRPAPLWEELIAAAGLARTFAAGAPDVGVICERGDVSGFVLAEWHSLRHALAELLANALACSPADQPVVVKQWRLDDHVFLRITDRGPGIPWKAQQDLFRRFHPATHTEHARRGIGMGLYLARQIIEANGGKLNLISSVGAGTTVAVSFPLIHAGEAVPGPATARLEEHVAG